MGELIFLCVLEAVGAVAFGMAFNFPRSIIDKSGGPAFFPQFVVGFMTFFILVRIIQILKTPKNERNEFHFIEIFTGERLVFVIATVMVTLLMRSAGFCITMSVYLIFLILFLHKRMTGKKASIKMISIVVVSGILGTIFIDYIFCAVMKVMIPRGIFGF